MANHFEVMTSASIHRHGLDVTLRKQGLPVFDELTLVSTATPVDYLVRSYPKHITATTYNFPNLIGKDVVLFYIGKNCEASPEDKDIVLYNDKRYVIESIQRHMAFGEVLLYRCLAVAS